jgi:hypothetical protein
METSKALVKSIDREARCQTLQLCWLTSHISEQAKLPRELLLALLNLFRVDCCCCGEEIPLVSPEPPLDHFRYEYALSVTTPLVVPPQRFFLCVDCVYWSVHCPFCGYRRGVSREGDRSVRPCDRCREGDNEILKHPTISDRVSCVVIEGVKKILFLCCVIWYLYG